MSLDIESEARFKQIVLIGLASNHNCDSVRQSAKAWLCYGSEWKIWQILSTVSQGFVLLDYLDQSNLVAMVLDLKERSTIQLTRIPARSLDT